MELKKNESIVKAKEKFLNSAMRVCESSLNNIENKLNAANITGMPFSEFDKLWSEKQYFSDKLDALTKEKAEPPNLYFIPEPHNDPEQKTITNRDHRLHWIITTQTDIEGKIERI